MIEYKDLNQKEKVLFEQIEKEFIDKPYLEKSEFVKVLGVLLNKYKR